MSLQGGGKVVLTGSRKAHMPNAIRRAAATAVDNANLLKAIYASTTDYAIITMDNAGIITSWNAGAKRVLGYQEHEIIGKSGDLLFTPEDIERKVPAHELATAQAKGRAADNRWHVRNDGSHFWGEGVVTPIHDDNKKQIGFLKIMHDDTERKQAETEMLRLANFDALTGLANRPHFQTRLSEMIAAASRSGQLLILQLIDLDNFKEINDSMGHQVGDLLLQQTAQRMRETVRDTDFIARLGGDEFVILQSAHTPQAGGHLASKLIDALSRPFEIDGHEVISGASIGIAVYPQDATVSDWLLKKADLALYRVKHDGRGGFSYFTEKMDEEVHRKSRGLRELRKTVENKTFWLEYQPEIDCKTRQVLSIEALLRFDNPVLSHYSVPEVIGLGEEAGLMSEIGAWVLSEACAQSKKWQDIGLPRVKISVNLCPRELLDPKMLETIDLILYESGLHPDDLEIEITERHMFVGNGRGVRALRELRARGISIVLDDFGSGYSSLNCLRILPIDRLKLDRGFLKEIPHNSQSCALAKAMIAMSHSLGITVVAEGVESAEQVDFFLREDCDALQGYYIGPPMSAEDISRYLWHQRLAEVQLHSFQRSYVKHQHLS